MNLPIKISKIDSSGGACPYQIEAQTEDGQYFYLRYRGGRFRAGVAPTNKDFWTGDYSKGSPYNIIDVKCGDDLDGSVYHEEFIHLLEGKVIFPEGFRMDSSFHYTDNIPEDDRDNDE